VAPSLQTFNDTGIAASGYTLPTLPLNGISASRIVTAGAFNGSIANAPGASRFIGLIASGGPTIGTWAVGDWGVDNQGNLYECTAAGTPGTWKPVANCTVLNGSAKIGTPNYTTGRFYIQAGSTVINYTTGGVIINFPTSFPNGLLAVIPINGDSGVNAGTMNIVTAGTAKTAFQVKVYQNNSATEVTNGAAVRIDWIAVGF
jgi:hypothetical protein